MSLFATPCLYITLGGEMILILEQRLDAQGIQAEKHQKIMRSIVANLLNERSLSSVFTSQSLLNKKRFKNTFNKLALASTVTLSKDASDKLFDLMIMALKYKVFQCKSGHELLMLTLSYLDDIKSLMEGAPKLIQIVNKAFEMCVKLYHSDLSPAQMELVRHTVLNFVQDEHKKVAIFLSQKIQLPNGKFVLSHDGTVPFGSEIPGRITYLQQNKVEIVPLTVQYYRVEKEGSVDENGDRRIMTQANLYGHERKQRARSISEELDDHDTKNTKEEELSSELVGNTELGLLQHLLIGFKSSSSVQQEPFKLTLFDDDDDATNDTKSKVIKSKSSEATIVKISNSESTRNPIMQEIMQDFQEQITVNNSAETNVDKKKGDDLLSLMDAL